MPDVNGALEKVVEYRRKFRAPWLPSFKISEIYSLFPTNETPDPKWPQKYPHGDRQGVYLILDETKKLLYVGKASMYNTLESRLSAYFSYDDDKSCRVKKLETWSVRPSFIITIAVPAAYSFEAPALEEYLIKSFSGELPDNKIGGQPFGPIDKRVER